MYYNKLFEHYTGILVSFNAKPQHTNVLIIQNANGGEGMHECMLCIYSSYAYTGARIKQEPVHFNSAVMLILTQPVFLLQS